MALAEVARLWTVGEARIAQSALRAAGLDVVIFDEHRASALWTEQLAIGGVRLMAHEARAPEVKAFLAAVLGPQTKAAAPQPHSPRDWLLAIATIVGCWIFGWSLAGFKQPDLFHRLTALGVVLTLSGGFIALRLLER